MNPTRTRPDTAFFEALEDRRHLNAVDIIYVRLDLDHPGDRDVISKGLVVTVPNSVIKIEIAPSRVQAFDFNGGVQNFTFNFMDPPTGLLFNSWVPGSAYNAVDSVLGPPNDLSVSAVSPTNDGVKTLAPFGVLSMTAPSIPGTYRVNFAPGTFVHTPFGDAMPGGFFHSMPLDIEVALPPDLTGTTSSVSANKNISNGQQIKDEVEIHNSGGDAKGKIIVDAYMVPFPGVDPVGDPAFSAKPIDIKLSDGESKKVPIQFNVPAGVSGPVRVVYKIRSADPDTIHESDTANNTFHATLGQNNVADYTVSLSFGTLNAGDKKPFTLNILDTDGDVVSFSIKGPGIGVVTPRVGGPPDVTVTGGNATTNVTIKVKKGANGNGEFDVHDINVPDAVGGFLATGINLKGNATLPGTANKLIMGKIDSDHLITFTAPPQGFVNKGLSLEFTEVDETSIISAVPIKSITAIAWRDRDGTPDTITAPSIGSITIKGDSKRRISGAFEAGIVVTDAAAKFALGSLTVAGTVSDAVIRSAGNIGNVTADAFVNVTLYAGIAEGASGIPQDGQIGTKSIDSVTIKDTFPATGFSKSFIAAFLLKKISLKDVNVSNNGQPCGLLAGKIDSYVRLSNTNSIVSKLSKLDTPIADAENIAGDDFAVRVV